MALDDGTVGSPPYGDRRFAAPGFDEGSELSLRDYLAIFGRHWTLMMLVLAAVVIAAGAYTLLTPVSYRATSTVLVHTASSQGLFARPPGNASSLYRTTASEFEYARSDALGSIVGPLPDGYRVDVDQSDERQSETITFSVTGTDADEVASIAEAYASAYVTTRESQVESDIAATLSGVDASIENLVAERDEILEPLSPIEEALANASDPDVISRLTTQRLTLLQTLDDDLSPIRGQLSILNNERSGLVILSSYLQQNDETGARILSAPEQGSALGPFLARNLVLATVVGSILAVALALLLENLRDRINSVEDVERAIPAVPVLATLPDFGDEIRVPLTWDGIAKVPSYRTGLETLITGLRFVAQSTPFASLVVCAASSDSGKSTVSASLAIATARAGADTVIVEGDLHRPDLTNFIGVGPPASQVPASWGQRKKTEPSSRSGGLTDVLVGAASIDEVLVDVDAQAGLRFLGRGSVSMDASDTWRTAVDTGLVDKITGLTDLVVFDSPPLLAVSDGLVIGSGVDAALLVARVKHTSAKELADAANRLRWAGVRVAGCVLVGGKVTRYYGAD